MQSRSTLLIVDDTETNVDILVELLSDLYEIVVALDGERALEILEEQKVDLILLDIMMPEIDGYEVCKRVKQNEKIYDIPIIFITAKTDEESIEKAYEVGGMDYITKPFKPKELFARIKTQLHIRALIEELENSKSELKRLSETDPMTNLCNRRYFNNASKSIIELARRDKTALTVVMLDIDKFKKVNDTYGHDVGDEIIISVANILLEMTRKSDLDCRFGGEEFILLLPETSLEGGIVIAEKIRKKVEAFSLHLEDDKEVKVTVSLGVSQLDTENDLRMESVIKRADIALYKAKESGRNKVCKEA